MTNRVVVTLTVETDGDLEVVRTMLSGYLGDTRGQDWMFDVMYTECLSKDDINLSAARHCVRVLEDRPVTIGANTVRFLQGELEELFDSMAGQGDEEAVGVLEDAMDAYIALEGDPDEIATMAKVLAAERVLCAERGY